MSPNFSGHISKLNGRSQFNNSRNNSSSVNIRMIEIKKRPFLRNIHFYFDFQRKKFVENLFASATMDHMLPLYSLLFSLLSIDLLSNSIVLHSLVLYLFLLVTFQFSISNVIDFLLFRRGRFEQRETCFSLWLQLILLTFAIFRYLMDIGSSEERPAVSLNI